MAGKEKFYVVWQGLVPGIYTSWQACQEQIKGYPNARYKAFPSRKEAEAALQAGPGAARTANGPQGKKPLRKDTSASRKSIIRESLAVDAACSGNPGIMEYRGVHTLTGEEIFYQKFPLGTNNIGEFLAIVHALALLKREGSSLPVYTDSATALKWVRQKKAKTTLVRNAQTEHLYGLIERAENWLKQNTYTTVLLKWDTEHWGEIPADFGRK